MTAPSATMNHVGGLALRLRMVLILAAVVGVAALATGGDSLQGANLFNVLRQASLEATIALAMTAVIITGGIDLSVGSVVALAGVAAALVMKALGQDADGAAGVLAIVAGGAAGVAVGAAVGTVTGSIIAWCALPPFIVTLAAMLICRGAAFIASGGTAVYEIPAAAASLGRGWVPVAVMLAGWAAAAFVLSRTVFGRQVVAVGSNEEAARRAGIDVRRVKLLVYAALGATSGLVGLLLTGKVMAGDPKSGEMWELNVIAAVVVGGTSLFGGRGTMSGTIVGALIIAVLNNTLNLLNMEAFWQRVTLGAVILAAGLADAGLRRLEGRRT